MSQKTSTRFYLIIATVGFLGLVGSACSRSTTYSDTDPTGTIEPDSESTGTGSASEVPIDMSDAGTGATAESDPAPDDRTSPEIPDAPTVHDEPAETPGETATDEEVREESGEPTADTPTYGDGGGGIPYHQRIPSSEFLGRVTATRTPGSINVFFRNSQGHLCRVMGPAKLVWGSTNRPQTACFDAYTIDRPPQVVYDPNRRKIYAFAVDVTGDLGQAHGFRFYVCDADSIRCTASTHLLWESRFHFYPALVFIKGATPAQDRIVGFSHAGDGGRLAYFTVDPNPESLRHGWDWVGPKLIPGDSVTACGEWAAIDRSPVAFFSADTGGESLHVMGRTGDGDLLHLQMSSHHLSAFKRGEGSLQFSCQKVSETFQGRDLIGNIGTRRRPFSLSPNAIRRSDGSIDVFGAVKAGDFSGWSMRLWTVDGGNEVGQASWLEELTTPSAFGPSMQMSLQLAPEERLTIVPEASGPDSTIHLFANVSQSVPVPGTESEATIHATVGPSGAGKTLEILPFRFGGQTSAVTDDQGNLHVFGASYETGSNGNLRLVHAARPVNGAFPWVKFAISAGQSIQKGGRGTGESGVTAIWVPGTSLLMKLNGL